MSYTLLIIELSSCFSLIIALHIILSNSSFVKFLLGNSRSRTVPISPCVSVLQQKGIELLSFYKPPVSCPVLKTHVTLQNHLFESSYASRQHRGLIVLRVLKGTLQGDNFLTQRIYFRCYLNPVMCISAIQQSIICLSL